jgi:hypothetical protein
MIAGEGIQEAKEVTVGGGVDDLMYPWEWIRILGTCFVETCEVHAEAPTAIGLWDNHRIGNPGGVRYLAYQLGLLQLLYFLDDEVFSLVLASYSSASRDVPEGTRLSGAQSPP